MSLLEYDAKGRLRQLEYTIRATQQGCSVVAACNGNCSVIVGWNGAVADALALPEDTIIWKVGESHCLAATGLSSDAQVLVRFLRRLNVEHTATFGRPMPTQRLASNLAKRIHASTMGGSRAFAAQCLVAGYDSDDDECQLFHVSAMGQLRSYQRVALGRGADTANKRLTVLLERRGTEEEETLGLTEDAVSDDEAEMADIALEGLFAAFTPTRRSRVERDDDSGSDGDTRDRLRGLHSAATAGALPMIVLTRHKPFPPQAAAPSPDPLRYITSSTVAGKVLRLAQKRGLDIS